MDIQYILFFDVSKLLLIQWWNKFVTCLNDAKPKLDIHECSLLIYSCIVVALPFAGKITLKLLMKADQAVVSQQMLVITPDTVSTPNTDNLLLKLVSWNASYVVFSIIVSSLTRHFFISRINSQFHDPLYSGPLFKNLTMCAFGSVRVMILSDEHKEMLLVMCIEYISSHVLCFFHHNQGNIC